MFDPTVYINRRRILRERISGGQVLFLGNYDSPVNYSANLYRFRQDSTFLYYWGLDYPALAALIDIDEGREVLFGDEPDPGEVIWTGVQSSVGEKGRWCSATETAPRECLQSLLEQAVGQDREVHTLPPYRPEQVLELEELLGKPVPDPSREFIDAVVSQRSVKSPREIEQIEAALEITYRMHTTAMKICQVGMVEREVAGQVEGLAYSLGGGLAYPIIFSMHGERLHNPSHQNVIEEGRLLLHDSGAESPNHYASDITRTFPSSGKFSLQQREIYELVLRMQTVALEALRPGVPYRDVHLAAAAAGISGLIELGLMKGSPRAALRIGAQALFFPHGLGHMLGLDVHDMEALGEDHVGYDQQTKRSSQFGLAQLRLARPLQAGFVITVEPGLYFIPELIDRWREEKKFTAFINYTALEKYRYFGGVRLEDDVLIENHGYRLLGKPIPKQVAEVEALASRRV